jgi:hypothetical protein
VTVPWTGTQPNDNTTFHVSLSENGRYVAFSSVARNLVEGYTRIGGDAYVRDLLLETTEIVSINANGTQGNNGSFSPTISADGRFVAFESSASNLVPDDTNGARDIFVYDRLASSNVEPTIDVEQETITVNEGDLASIGGTYQDADESDDVTISASIGTVVKTGTNTGAWSWEFQTSDGPAESQTVNISADDGNGGIAEVTFDLVVENVAPDVSEISAPVELVPTNTQITASATFTDPGVLDTHTATWDWGDGQTSTGTVMQGAGFGSVEDSHTYTQPGVYAITLTVTDNDGGSGVSIFEFVLVGDPNPANKDDCMDGGWQEFGFRNQGLCIQFVNTGQDSRE